MRSALFALLAALAGLAALLFLFRAPLALRLAQVGIERQLAADPLADLGDGLHVVLCGAGGPLPDPDRSGPCTALIAGGAVYVVDAGMGGARNLGPLGVPAGEIRAVFLTHTHSDHIDGLGELAMLRWVGRAHETPLPVYGPRGIEAVVDGFNRAYRADAAYRSAHHGDGVAPPSGAGMRAAAFATPSPGEATRVFEADGLRVTSFAVDHAPVTPAVGYRFDYAGRSVLISGDTVKSAELERNAVGVDLLIHEALAADLVGIAQRAAADAGNAILAKITADIPDYHTTPVEAAEIAAAAGVGHLLYSHVVPPLILPGLESAFLRGVADAYAGGVTVGRDGTRVFLPRDSDAIEVSR